MAPAPAARTRRLVALCAAALAAAAACGSPPRKICFTLPPAPPPVSDLQTGRVQVTFLGVGGVIVRWQGAAVLTAPLYSNPTVGEMALSEIHADPQLIDALLRQDVSDVKAILVGHSHYDHLMDVPYVALHRAKEADILGNEAMVKVLHPIRDALASRPRKEPSGVDAARPGIRAPGSVHTRAGRPLRALAADGPAPDQPDRAAPQLARPVSGGHALARRGRDAAARSSRTAWEAGRRELRSPS